MMKQKKGFLLRDFVVVGLIFGLTISLYLAMAGSIAANYNNQEMVSKSFAEHYGQLSSFKDKVNTAQQATQGGQGGLNLIGNFNVAYNAVFTVIVMVWDSVLIYTGMAGNISSDFNFLDSTITIGFLTGIIAIISTYLIFIWLSSVSRGKI